MKNIIRSLIAWLQHLIKDEPKLLNSPDFREPVNNFARSNSVDWTTYKRRGEELKGKLSQVKNAILVKKLKTIINNLFQIIEYLESDNKKANMSKQVFSYHLDSLSKIIEKYIKLSSSSTDVKELISYFEKVEPSFDQSIEFLNNFFNRIKEDDNMSLDVEINFFKQI